MTETLAPAAAQPRGSNEIEAALRAGLDAAAGSDQMPALVGILGGPGPPVIRARGGVDGATIEALYRHVSSVPDGMVPPAAGPVHGWTGCRAAVGDGRTAFAMLRADGNPVPDAGGPVWAALAIVRAALLADDRRRTDQLNQLLATARRVAESLDLETVLAAIVQDATTLLGADSGDMLLWDREHDVLRVVAVWNFPPEMIGFELAFGEGLSSQAIRAQRTLGVDDYGTYEHRARALDRYDFGSVLCAPLLFRGTAIGALNVHARDRGHRFSPSDADLLAAFAGHAAIAIDHARRFENEVRLGQVLADTNRELSRSLTVQQRLAEQVLLDAGPAGIARVLAEHLRRSIVIQDHLHRLIAGASPDGGESWRSLVDQGGASSGAAPGAPDSREPFAVAVRVGREVAGHLLLSSDDDLAPIDRALVDVATTGVALEFAKVRAALEAEAGLRGEVASDLLGGTYPSEEAIAARAARLGYDLAEPRDLLVVDLAPGRDADGAPDWTEHERQRRLLDLVRERLASRAPRGLATVHAGTLVVLTAPTRQLDGRQLALDLHAALRAAGTGDVTIVQGDRCSRPDDYAAAFRVAREAMELLGRLGRRGAIVSTADLGPYSLLLRASSREDLESFARRALQPLADHDRRTGGELVRTLRIYLEEDRVQRRAAARSFVHVNTIVYRIRRIEELLGARLDDPATVFDLTLALRILDLVEPPIAPPSGAPARKGPRPSG